MADTPVWLPVHPWLVSALLAVAVAWGAQVAGWSGADTPAHLYRVELFREVGFNLVQNQWYAGHHTPMYSLLFPALGSLLTASGLALASLGLSVACLHLLAREFASTTAARVATLLFAAGMVSNVVVGRYAFQLGVALGLAAALAQVRGRPWLALGLAVATSASSPVAGAFLALGAFAVAATSWLDQPRPRVLRPKETRPFWLAVAAVVPIAVLSVLFPEGGWFPFAAGAFVATILTTALVAWFVPVPAVRLAALLYGACTVLAFVVRSPMGANASRLAMYAALPLGAVVLWSSKRRWVVMAFVPLVLVWQWAPAVDAITRAPSDPSVHFEYYEPLLAFFETAAPEGTRVEIPFTKRHWEVANVSAHVALARGWERQIDIERNPIFYDEAPLNPSTYLRWLRELGVRFVALPDAEMDESSVEEAALLRAGIPGLEPVWSNANWQVWEVTATRPLVEGSARLVHLGMDRVELEATRAGGAVVRVRYSQYWQAEGDACVTRAPGDWVVVHAPAPGPVVLTASLDPVASLGLLSADDCPSPSSRETPAGDAGTEE